MLARWLAERRRRQNRRTYRDGALIRRFVARDVCREAQIIDTSELDAGFVRARVRTWNLLYVHRGLSTEPGFGEVRRIHVDELWKWSGESWGGPVPEDEVN